MIGRCLILGLALAAPFAFSSPAQASADSTCYPDWKVKQTDFQGCNGMALLSPGNDTRINLLMLLYDRHGDVGVTHATGYDAMERRGDAQPFDFGVFALAVGQKPPEAEGGTFYGTRCISNDKGRVDFDSAIASAHQVKGGISSAELESLTNARAALQPDCASDTPFRPAISELVALVSSQSGKGFADYLLAAASFYDGNFAAARTLFLSLSTGRAGWVKEASAYMLGRVELNLGMESAFDDYGYPMAIPANSRELKAAEGAFKTYITAYPKGRYTASAQGLLRKIYWMGGDTGRLTAEYVAAFKRGNMSGSNVSLADLVQEMDVKIGEKLDIANVNDPALLAMLALQDMRTSDDPKMQRADPPISRAAIEALKPRFTGQNALYDYVRAAHALYVEKDAATALRILPADASGDSYLVYSQRALRALALDAKGDPAAREALAAVLANSSKPFQRGTMEMALAMHDERSAGLEKVFAADSPIKDPEVRERLLRYSAGPALLRYQAATNDTAMQERKVALYTLLYKQLTRGNYQGFVTDTALIPAGVKPHSPDDYSRPTYTNVGIFKWAGQKDGFACPSLKTLATALAGAPKDAPSLLCLGEFVRLNNLDGGASWPDIPGSLDVLPPKDQLGGTPSQFPGKPFSRLEAYKGVIASPAADAGSKAYALYRAVYCYAPSGYNSCGGVEVPIATRKGWFNQLKKSYPASPWTAKLKYYW